MRTRNDSVQAAPDALGSLQPHTFARAAELLGISKRTLQRVVDRGEIAVTIIGGRPRILQRHIERYLERQTRDAVV